VIGRICHIREQLQPGEEDMAVRLCTLKMYFHGFPGYYSWIAKEGEKTVVAGERFRLGLNWSNDAYTGALEERYYDKILADLVGLGWEPLSTDSNGKIVRLKKIE
jgi:hypothetical protein